jgi:hypothetical protein
LVVILLILLAIPGIAGGWAVAAGPRPAMAAAGACVRSAAMPKAVS